jgi:hypothetical protein
VKRDRRVLRTYFRIEQQGVKSLPMLFNDVDKDFDDIPNYKTLTGECLTESHLHRR